MLLGTALMGCHEGESTEKGAHEAAPELSNRFRRRAVEVPAYYLNSQVVHPSCAKETFVSSPGSSEKSAHAARESATTTLIQSIQTSIRVESRRVVSRRISNRSREESMESSEVAYFDSAFSHGELIRIVEEAELNKTFYALACLDIRAAGEAIERDLASNMRGIRSSAERALSAKQSKDRSSFAAAQQLFRSRLEDATRLLMEYRAVTRSASALEEEVNRLEEEVLMAATDLVRETSVGVSMASTGDRDSKRQIRNHVQVALSELGIGRVSPNARCRRGSGPEIALSVAIAENCSWGSLGHTCQPLIEVSGTDCASGDMLFDTPLEFGRIRASNADRKVAQQKALKKLKPAHFRSELFRLLSAEIPFPFVDGR